VAKHCIGKQVLLVDDSNSDMSLIQNTMERLSVTFIDFNSAVKVLSYLEKEFVPGQAQKIYLIISDMEMPGMDRFAFTHNQREIKELAATQIAPCTVR